jgi:hypothetical protein
MSNPSSDTIVQEENGWHLAQAEKAMKLYAWSHLAGPATGNPSINHRA